MSGFKCFHALINCRTAQKLQSNAWTNLFTCCDQSRGSVPWTPPGQRDNLPSHLRLVRLLVCTPRNREALHLRLQGGTPVTEAHSIGGYVPFSLNAL